MTANTTSKKSLGLAGTLMVRCAGLVLTIALLLSTNSAKAATIYSDGNDINLVTGRHNTFTSSGNAGGQLTGPIRLSYPDIRFDAANSVNGAYWQVNFPTAYEVSHVAVETHPAPYRMTGMNVQTTTDGINWITQATPTVSGPDPYLDATFAPVSGVVGVRLVSTGSENAGYPAIFRQIRVDGPNAATPLFLNSHSEFSVASAIWNDGSVQSAPGWNPYSGGGSTIAPIDDATVGTFTYNKTIYSTSAADPAPIDLLLNQNFDIDAVAITTGSEVGSTGRTATHVDISYDSDASGLFTPILTNYALLGSPDGHYVVNLGGIFDARRVRFDFSHPGSTAGDTFISELQVFAFDVPPPAPEPSSVLLLGGGLALMAMKRRRQGKVASTVQA